MLLQLYLWEGVVADSCMSPAAVCVHPLDAVCPQHCAAGHDRVASNLRHMLLLRRDSMVCFVCQAQLDQAKMELLGVV